MSGGPPPDGIPPLDEPAFDDVADVEWLADDEAVLVLDVGEPTTFTCEPDGRFVDAATGSMWALDGRAMSGPATGAGLVVPFVETFWFAWATFHVGTPVAAP